MPSTFRTTAAAVVLAVLLGLCAVPANAQPQGVQAGNRVETKVLAEVWHWLTGLLAPSGAREKGLTLLTNQSTADLSVVNRGGAYDPNGHS
jgi:hypothetical protein